MSAPLSFPESPCSLLALTGETSNPPVIKTPDQPVSAIYFTQKLPESWGFGLRSTGVDVIDRCSFGRSTGECCFITARTLVIRNAPVSSSADTPVWPVSVSLFWPSLNSYRWINRCLVLGLRRFDRWVQSDTDFDFPSWIWLRPLSKSSRLVLVSILDYFVTSFAEVGFVIILFCLIASFRVFDNSLMV